MPAALSAPPELVELAAALEAAKSEEDAAKERRIAAEEAVIALLKFQKAEGSETYDATSPAGSCKVTIKRPINRSVDAETWVRVRKDVPRAIAKLVMRDKYELDTKAARKIEAEDPATWKIIAEAVTSKPGKIGVEIKKIALGAVEA